MNLKLILPHSHRFPSRSSRVEASSGFLANLLWLGLNVPMPRLDAFIIITNQFQIRSNQVYGKVVAGCMYQQILQN